MRRLRDKFFVFGWRSLVGLGVLALVALGASNTLAQPANDNFTNATSLDAIALPGTLTDNNTGATLEFGERPIGTNVGGASVWYTWTAPADCIVNFDTIGSDFDTLLGVFVGNRLNNAFLVAFDNDSGGSGTSKLSFLTPAGTVFHIMVDGTNGAQGNIVLNWSTNPPPPPPVNDNFAGATTLDTSLAYGSISDDNTRATPEGNEPRHGGFPASHSLWYKWVATQDGEVEVDTIGSSFDTVLAVYTGSSVSTLSQVAANDDLYPTFSAPGFGQYAQTNFVGVYIDTTNVPVPPGQLVISPTNTAPTPPIFFAAGEFGYFQAYSGLPVNSSLGSGASGLRFNAKAGTTYYFAVDGKSGEAGSLNLNWAYHPAGLFRFASENRDQFSGVPGMLLYQEAETVEFGYRQGTVNLKQFQSSFQTVYDYSINGVVVTITRVAGSSGRMTVDYATVDGNSLSSHYTFDSTNDVLVPDGTPRILNGDAPAIANVDYTPAIGTLTFDDFEMSKSIVIPITDDAGTPQPNRDFAVVLFNAQKDSLESATVSQPRLDSIDSQALVRIMDADIDPRGPGRTNDGPYTNVDNMGITNVFTNTLVTLTPTNAVINFLKANYRIPEDASDFYGNTPITVYVNRSGPNNAAVSVFYQINGFFLNSLADEADANYQFPLQPGSDYATPDLTARPEIYGRAPIDFTATRSGSLSWAAKKFDPQPITFVINNDNVTEFNEDFRIDLYDVNSDDVVVPVGMINETTVTIMFDDEDPPAGSVDEFYNPDFGLDLIRPVNGTPVGTEPRQQPGTEAQGQVNALVVQPGDDKTIIGGDFSTYNGASRHGIARINNNGELDTTFDPGDGISIVTGDFVSSMALQLDGKLLVAGSFTSFNGQSCGNLIRLNTNGTLDASFRLTAGSGANGTVRSVSIRPNGKILIGGDFTLFNGASRKYVAQLNADGSVDGAYNPVDALNGPVYTVAQEVGNSIAVSANANGGSVEYTNIISVGATSGLLSVDYDMLQVPDDLRVYYGDTNTAAGTGVLIYDSGSVSGTNRVVIPFGPTNGLTATTIEIVMNQGNGNPGTLWFFDAAIQTFGSDLVTVGGDFTAAGGVFGQDHIARLLADGTLDNSFDPGSGANGRVRTIVAQTDGKVIIGGDFTTVNGQNETHITRLNVNGTVDTGFFSGTGTDGGVYHLNYVPGGLNLNQVLVGTNIVTVITTNADFTYVGGPFTLYNGTHRLGFARLNADGSLDTSFLDTAYNQFAGLPRTFYGDRFNAVFASAVQHDNNVMIGGSFNQVGGGQFDPLIRPEPLNTFQYKEPKQRDGVRNRNNVARLIGGMTPGPGNIGLLSASYPATKSQGFIYTLLTRTNGALGYASANFSVTPGTAQAGPDYQYYGVAPAYPVMWEYIGPSRMHSDGLWGTNTVMNDVFSNVWSLGFNSIGSALVTIQNNSSVSGNTHAQFQLANPPSADQFYLGGQNIPLGVALGRTFAPLDITDDGKKPGAFGFTALQFAGSTTTSITVSRTNGLNNTSPILMDYSTAAGTGTVSGVDYFDTSGTLTFNDGETLKAFPVQIISSNYISSVEKSVNLSLRNIRGAAGAVFGLSNSVLRIINPNFQGFLNFSATNYVTNLSARTIQFTVTRTVGGKGTLDVTCSTANGSAFAGVDFVNTSTNLHWDNQDVSPRTVSVPLLNNGTVGGTNTFYANLTNPLLNGVSAPSLLGTVTTTALTIINDNNYGLFQFSAPTYVVNEATNGFATITVVRSGSVLSNVMVSYTTLDGTAHAGTNYVATSGTLSFAPGQVTASFPVQILNDGLTEIGPFYFNVAITNLSPGALFGSPTNAQVNIVDAQSFNRPPGSIDVTFNPQGINADVLALGLQSDGAIVAGGNFVTVNGIPRNHFARFHSDGSLDTDFLNGLSGADGAVYSLAIQSDGRILLGGAFGTLDGVTRNGIARVGTDGTLDANFGPGSGADGPVFALAEAFTSDGTRQIYAGGSFTSFQSGFHPGIVRLNDNGSLDATFINTGVNGIVYAIAVYPTNSIFAGKVLIGGSFTTVNGSSQANIARLNADGSLDTSFVVNADGIVRSLAIQNDNSALVGGEFTHVNGTVANRLARLNTSGSVDTAFASALGSGFTDAVNVIAVQADNRIVLGGQFLTVNGVTRHHITRLLPSGAPDLTINFGDGANGNVNAAIIQPADQFILIGGGFTQYDDQPAPYLTRIYGGSATGSGALEFTSASYQVNENGLQAAITVRRAGGTSGPNPDGSGNVSVQFSTTPGTAVPGVNYTTVNTTVSFAPGEVLQQVFVPVIDDLMITSNTTVNLALSNPTSPAGLGDQTNAVLTIVNTDNSVSFSSDNYQVAKNTANGVANITIVRQGSVNGTVTVGFTTTTNGTAVAGTDYTPTNAAVIFNPGDLFKIVQISVTNNNLPEGDRTVTMAISNILNAIISSPSNAVLTIRDTTFSPGQLSFANTNFFANEGDGNAVVTVIRTGGSSGTVSATYFTTANTAIPGLNYISQSNIVSFSDGQTNRTITIPLIDNSLSQGQLNFTVSLLTNLNSGTTLAYPSNATVYIADNDSGFAFVNSTNTVRETDGQAVVGVIRIGPTNTSLSVDYATHDLTAIAGTNYTTTAGTLVFGPGQVNKSILIPVLDDPDVTGNLLFTVVLSTNAGSLGSQLAYPSTNTVVILDADAGISFTNSSLIVRRDAGDALITVVCSNPGIEPPPGNTNTAPLSVQYTTTDGSALAGVDYITTSGTMLFTNGNGTNTFNVPIINNGSVSGDRAFSVRLFNATVPGRIVAPSNETVTIIDATAGFKFSKTAYSVNKTDGSAIINVFRTGLTDSVATVDFLATNGSAIDGLHYVSTNGTLVFTNGVTNQTFSVQVIDTTAVQPNKTVLLELMNPVNSTLSTPSAATLTIRDNTGSYVVPAGSALISESGAGAPNGVIDSNETVTVLFGFRDGGGLNVGNLTATLIASTGVIPVPNPETQTYGPLISGSHSVSEPFTFTAVGTNGQEILATFQLKDTGTNIGTAVFGYTLGSFTTSFTNGAAIIINDHAIASPYPSVIGISNLVGSVLKATITLTNMVHASPRDIDALLVSPDQRTTLFMAHAGGQNAISNVTLNFDDAASTTLPQFDQIISGTNKPSAYLPVPVFP